MGKSGSGKVPNNFFSYFSHKKFFFIPFKFLIPKMSLIRPQWEVLFLPTTLPEIQWD